MAALALAFALSLGRAAMPSPSVEGVVFVDGDGDGRFGPGDTPLPQALVSDGHTITRTAGDGRFALPWRRGGKVLLLKPAGFAPLPDQEGRLRLWREADPEGGPILFPLVARGEVERLLLFADPQVGERDEIAFVRASLERPLAAEPPVCARVVLGDLVADRPALYPALQAVLEDGLTPLFALPGNHDLEPGASLGEDPFRSFRASFGSERYAFHCGGLKVLMLPGVVPRYVEGRLVGYAPGLTESDLLFAEGFAAVTAAGAPTVIATHAPLTEPAFPPDQRERLLRAFSGSPVALVAGHWHRQELRVGEEGIDLFWAVGAVSGSYWTGPPGPDGIPLSWMSDGTARGYGVLEWVDGRFRPHYRPAGEAGRAPLHAFLPKVVEQGSYPSAMLSVNLYLGHAGSAVRFRVGEGAWQGMERQSAVDPLLLPILVEQDQAARLPEWRRLPEPRPSSHLWRARLPTDLAEGEQGVEIEAEDGFGGRHRLEASYRIEARRRR